MIKSDKKKLLWVFVLTVSITIWYGQTQAWALGDEKKQETKKELKWNKPVDNYNFLFLSLIKK